MISRTLECFDFWGHPSVHRVPCPPKRKVEPKKGSLPPECGHETHHRLLSVRKLNHYRLFHPPDYHLICSLASYLLIEILFFMNICAEEKNKNKMAHDFWVHLYFDLIGAKPCQIFWICTFSICRRSKGTWISHTLQDYTVLTKFMIMIIPFHSNICLRFRAECTLLTTLKTFGVRHLSWSVRAVRGPSEGPKPVGSRGADVTVAVSCVYKRSSGGVKLFK